MLLGVIVLVCVNYVSRVWTSSPLDGACLWSCRKKAPEHIPSVLADAVQEPATGLAKLRHDLQGDGMGFSKSQEYSIV